jgi:hypothetical protein
MERTPCRFCPHQPNVCARGRDLCADIETLTATGQHTVDDLERGDRRLARLVKKIGNVRALDRLGAGEAEVAAAALAGCRDALDGFAKLAHQAAEAGPPAPGHN